MSYSCLSQGFYPPFCMLRMMWPASSEPSRVWGYATLPPSIKERKKKKKNPEEVFKSRRIPVFVTDGPGYRSPPSRRRPLRRGAGRAQRRRTHTHPPPPSPHGHTSAAMAAAPRTAGVKPGTGSTPRRDTHTRPPHPGLGHPAAGLAAPGDPRAAVAASPQETAPSGIGETADP